MSGCAPVLTHHAVEWPDRWGQRASRQRIRPSRQSSGTLARRPTEARTDAPQGCDRPSQMESATQSQKIFIMIKK